MTLTKGRKTAKREEWLAAEPTGAECREGSRSARASAMASATIQSPRHAIEARIGPVLHPARGAEHLCQHASATAGRGHRDRAGETEVAQANIERVHPDEQTRSLGASHAGGHALQDGFPAAVTQMSSRPFGGFAIRF